MLFIIPFRFLDIIAHIQKGKIMDIYTLTTEYKTEVATETNASLRSCELLYQIQSALLEKYDNNTNNAKYKKEIASIRKECSISKTQFNSDVAVGKLITSDLPGGRFNNEIATLTKKQIYTKYCSTPRPKTEKTDKIDYKQKYDELLIGYKKLLTVYEKLKNNS